MDYNRSCRAIAPKLDYAHLRGQQRLSTELQGSKGPPLLVEEQLRGAAEVDTYRFVHDHSYRSYRFVHYDHFGHFFRNGDHFSRFGRSCHFDQSCVHLVAVLGVGEDSGIDGLAVVLLDTDGASDYADAVQRSPNKVAALDSFVARHFRCCYDACCYLLAPGFDTPDGDWGVDLGNDLVDLGASSGDQRQHRVAEQVEYDRSLARELAKPAGQVGLQRFGPWAD